MKEEDQSRGGQKPSVMLKRGASIAYNIVVVGEREVEDVE